MRQRVAFALSEIFVVSDRSDALASNPVGLAHYYDMLSTNAFGTYRELLEQVTLHPVMGVYLGMLRNRKPDAARELMRKHILALDPWLGEAKKVAKRA